MTSINAITSSIGHLFPNKPIETHEITHSSTSSISSAEDVTEHWTPERPGLTQPSDLPLSDYRLLAVTEVTRNLGNEIMDALTQRLTSIKIDIQKISSENMEKLKEAAERANTSDMWSILKKIATCLLSALSLVMGVALIASGGGALVGGAMIASGVLSLANFAVSELGTWDWVAEQLANGNEEHKKMIAMILPAAVGILAGGIGVVGSVAGVASGAVQFADKAVVVAQTVLTLFDATTTLGKGIADGRQLWTKSDLVGIQADLTVQRELFSSTIEEIKSSMNDFKGIKSKSRKAIEMIAETNTRAARFN